MLTLSWLPSGPPSAGAWPRSESSTRGAALTSTCPAATACSRPSSSAHRTSAPSRRGCTATTFALVRSSAPAERAAPVSASTTAPIPPTGTSQSPVPPPITWYRKQRFCASVTSWAPAKVPMSASVRTTPRTRSWATLRSTSSPSGVCRSSHHACPIAALASAVVGSGSVMLGKSAWASAWVRSPKVCQAPWSAAAPTAANERRVASASPVSTSSPRAGSPGTGVYEATRRRRSSRESPSSSRTARGMSETRYE